MEEKEELFKLQLRAFLCGVGTCIDMILDLLEDDDEEDEDTLEEILNELCNDECEDETCKAKVVTTKISPEKFKKIVETLKNKEEE